MSPFRIPFRIPSRIAHFAFQLRICDRLSEGRCAASEVGIFGGMGSNVPRKRPFVTVRGFGPWFWFGVPPFVLPLAWRVIFEECKSWRALFGTLQRYLTRRGDKWSVEIERMKEEHETEWLTTGDNFRWELPQNIRRALGIENPLIPGSLPIRAGAARTFLRERADVYSAGMPADQQFD